MALINIAKCVKPMFRLYSYQNSKSITRHFISKTEETRPIIKKWVRYWEDLAKDYFDVLKETSEHCKSHPVKSFSLFTLIGFSYVCFETNPDEISYRDRVLEYSNDVLLVDQVIRNPNFDKFLTSLETCYNFGVIRRLNLGIFSVIWIDNLSNELGLYKRNCTYLKPEYLGFYQRIIDVGFLGKWWRIDSLVLDYDVNIDEWTSKE